MTRALDKSSRARANYSGTLLQMLHAITSLHTLRTFVMRALDKNSQARANYSGALLSILRAVAFCTRVFVKYKSSGTVVIFWLVSLLFI